MISFARLLREAAETFFDGVEPLRAIAGVALPVVQTHLSNIYAKKAFRNESVLAPVRVGAVAASFGHHSYFVAVEALLRHVDHESS